MRNYFVAISCAMALQVSGAKPTKLPLENPETFQVVQQILYDAERFIARRHPLEEAEEFEAEVELHPLPYKFSETTSNIFVGNPHADRVADILICDESGQEYFLANYQACTKLQLDIFIFKKALMREYPDMGSESQHSQRILFCLRIALLQFNNGLGVTGIMNAETSAVARDILPEFFVAQDQLSSKKAFPEKKLTKK